MRLVCWLCCADLDRGVQGTGPASLSFSNLISLGIG